jgi:hypothetical protein
LLVAELEFDGLSLKFWEWAVPVLSFKFGGGRRGNIITITFYEIVHPRGLALSYIT